MLENKSALKLACISAYLAGGYREQWGVNAQIDEILETKEDPRLSDNWPKVFSTDFTAIREGATEDNDKYHWLDGRYKTILDLLGNKKFEMDLELHNPI